MWEGREEPWHVIVLAEQLTLNPHSRVFAIRGGTRELQGWDAQTVIAARTHNLIAHLIAGLSKSSADDLLIEHPAREAAAAVAAEAAQQRTLADLFSSGALNEFFKQ